MVWIIGIKVLLHCYVDSTNGNEVVSPSCYCSVNVSVMKNPDLERFWSLETIGIKNPMSKERDKEVYY